MYQALYRKWRPQTFDEVVGQKHITDTLKNQVRTGRLSHAYIFIGTRGTGKTTCARILAKAVNCEHPVDGNPCGRCPACLGIADGSIMDVVELDAASNNKVDNVRALREEAVFSPASVKKRVYIIDEVHMLTTSAFNALLKILEEPPEHLMFILATTELQKVPATILSRCQRHSFHRLEASDISDHLEYIAKNEGFDLTHDASELIAGLAEGGLRDALSLLDQCSAHAHIDVEAVYDSVGLAGNRRIAALLESILAHDTASAVSDFSKMWMDGKDPSTFLRELSSLLRDIMIISVAPKSGGSLITGGYDRQLLNSFASRMTTEETVAAMETVQRSLSAMRDAGNPRTVAELCLVSLCDNTAGDSIASLKARISRLEEEMARGVPVMRSDERYVPREDFPQEDGEGFDIFEEEEPEGPSAVIEEKEEAQPRQEVEPALPEVTWEQIRDKAAHTLPMGIAMNLNDRQKIYGEVHGGVLKLFVQPGFFYTQINRQEIIGKFAAAASELCGTDIRAVVSEMSKECVSRDVSELKAFPEVKFI